MIDDPREIIDEQLKETLLNSLIEYKEILQKRIFYNRSDWSKNHLLKCSELSAEITQLYIKIKDF